MGSAVSGDSPAPQTKSVARSSRRVWRLRLAAILLGLSVFVVAEGVCRLFGVGVLDVHEDPFVGFSAEQPLFVRDAEGQRYEIAAARQKFFAPDSFSATKAPGTFRIFCLGGSTVQGRPYSIQTSFTTWLRLALEQAAPETRWEVVNCGGISYASYRLVPIMTECLGYQPDLFVVCTGHNEFLEDRTYANVRGWEPFVSRPHRTLSRLRSYNVYRNLLLSANERPASAARPVLASDVDAILDYHEGLRAYHRDDAWRAGVIEHFRFNLHRMAQLAREHDVPMLLILPPSNLSDSPPFKSQHRDGLTPGELVEFDRLSAEAFSRMAADPRRAASLLQAAIEIDPRFAAIRFQLGKVYESLFQFDQARREFLAAREEDICPLRILTPLEDAIREVAREWSLPLLDAHALLEAQTRSGILGDALLVDHVHPSFEGHQRIALALVEELARSGVVQPQPEWRARSRATFQSYFDALPTFYFLSGQRTLESLRAWSKGRADGPHVNTRFPHHVED